MAAVLQGKISNFDTDLFVPLIQRAGELTGTRPGASPRSDASLRIIADHARASTFLISDGVVPSNEGRGYVLRKILRRGIRHGRLLGATEPFMSDMTLAVHAEMRGAYPELDETIQRIVESGSRGRNAIRTHAGRRTQKNSTKTWKQSQRHVSTGAKAFKLYDTYGLPLDFITDAVRDLRLNFDEPGFQTRDAGAAHAGTRLMERRP